MHIRYAFLYPDYRRQKKRENQNQKLIEKNHWIKIIVLTWFCISCIKIHIQTMLIASSSFYSIKFYPKLLKSLKNWKKYSNKS